LAVSAFRQPVDVEAGKESRTAQTPRLQGIELMEGLKELMGEVSLAASHFLKDLYSR